MHITDTLSGIPWPSNHARARMEERHDIQLDHALCEEIIAAINRSRVMAITNPADFAGRVANGAVQTKIQAAPKEQWSVRVGSLWINLVVNGTVIITVLPNKAAKKPGSRPRSGRSRDQELCTEFRTDW